MKLLKTSFTALLLSLFVLGAATESDAQDKRAAIKTYNKALELAKSQDYEQAINMYNQAITQAKELGEEGQDILERSQGRLPSVYLQLAFQKYKAFQKDQSLTGLNDAIESFRQTKDVADEYNDSKTAAKANNIVKQLMYSKSILQYQQKNYQDALATLDQVIERDSTYSKAYYQKAIVVKNMNSKNLEEAIALFDKAIKMAEKFNDSQIVTRAKESVREELVYRGSNATDEKNYDRAIELLNRALDYDPDSPNAHYRLAVAYNKTQSWQDAVDHAQESLDLSTGGKTDKAKIYFELGTAYKGLGQKEDACTAFGNAAYGSFKSPAEHQMEYELKCESMSN